MASPLDAAMKKSVVPQLHIVWTCMRYECTAWQRERGGRDVRDVDVRVLAGPATGHLNLRERGQSGAGNQAAAAFSCLR
jgi:hypothetical protein